MCQFLYIVSLMAKKELIIKKACNMNLNTYNPSVLPTAWNNIDQTNGSRECKITGPLSVNQ